LQRIIETSIEAVKPSVLFEQGFHLSRDKLDAFGKEIELGRRKRIRSVAIGKSAESMAYEVEKRLGDRVTGIVATPVEKHLDVKGFRFFKTGHPFPDEGSVNAAMEIRDLVSSCSRDDLLIFLISGGGSAAAFLPVEELSLGDVNETLKLLFDNGVPIDKVNLVRRHISLLGGGKLAALAPESEKVSLIISDVVGDDLVSIASGPTVEDSSTPIDACNFLAGSGMMDKIPQSIREILSKPGDQFSGAKLKNNFATIIASNIDALSAAEKSGNEAGFNSTVLTRCLDLDTENSSDILVSLARSVESDFKEVPALILLGGETTVKLMGAGKGGRNQHLVLEALYKLAELSAEGFSLGRTTIFSFGTDGKDGNTDSAGAYASIDILKNVKGELPEIKKYILRNNSNSFFEKYGGLITTGPTDTNVMDVMGIIVE
jgi:glycerate-2-kinase